MSAATAYFASSTPLAPTKSVRRRNSITCGISGVDKRSDHLYGVAGAPAATANAAQALWVFWVYSPFCHSSFLRHSLIRVLQDLPLPLQDLPA